MRWGEGRGKRNAPALDGADVGLGRADGRRPRNRGPRRAHHLKQGRGQQRPVRARRAAGNSRSSRARACAVREHRSESRTVLVMRSGMLTSRLLPTNCGRGSGQTQSRLLKEREKRTFGGGGSPCRGGTRTRRGGAYSPRARSAPAHQVPLCPAPDCQRSTGARRGTAQSAIARSTRIQNDA